MAMKAQLNVMQETLKQLVENQVTKVHFDEKIVSLEARIDKQDKVIETVSEDFKKLKKQVNEEMPDNIYKEIHNQEKCKKNVISFGFAEQPGSSNRARHENDKAKVHQMLEAINDIDLVSEGEITFRIRRLGKFNAESAIPRPLQISFNTTLIRDIVLQCCKKLKGKEEWEGVSVVPDLTKTQQKLSKTMRSELQKEAEKKNNDRKDNETDKFVFKVRGHYGLGNLRVAKIYLHPEEYDEEE